MFSILVLLLLIISAVAFKFKNTVYACNIIKKSLYSTFSTEEFGTLFDLEGNPSKKLEVTGKNTDEVDVDGYSTIRFDSHKDDSSNDRRRNQYDDINNNFMGAVASNSVFGEPKQRCRDSCESTNVQKVSNQQNPSRIASLRKQENNKYTTKNRHNNYDSSDSEARTSQSPGTTISYEKQRTGTYIQTEIQKTIVGSISSKLRTKIKPLHLGIAVVLIVAGGLLIQQPTISTSLFLKGEIGATAVSTATRASATAVTAANTISINPIMLYAGLSL